MEIASTLIFLYHPQILPHSKSCLKLPNDIEYEDKLWNDFLPEAVCFLNINDNSQRKDSYVLQQINCKTKGMYWQKIAILIRFINEENW